MTNQIFDPMDSVHISRVSIALFLPRLFSMYDCQLLPIHVEGLDLSIVLTYSSVFLYAHLIPDNDLLCRSHC